MRGKVHIDSVVAVENERVYLEVYVIKGEVKLNMVVEGGNFIIDNILNEKRVLKRYERGVIALKGDFLDFDDFIGLNLTFRSKNFLINFKDIVIEKLKEFIKKRRERRVILR